MSYRKKKVRILDDEGYLSKPKDYSRPLSKDEELAIFLGKQGKRNADRLVEKQMNRRCIFVKKDGTKCNKKVNHLLSPYCAVHTPSWLSAFYRKKESPKSIKRENIWKHYDRTHKFQDDVPAI